MDLVADRLASHRGGRWNDQGSVNGSSYWSIGGTDDRIDIEVQNLHDRLDASRISSTSAIVVRLGEFTAVKVDCRRTQSLGLNRDGPSATTEWAIAACRLALAHGRPGQNAGWSPGARIVASMRALHDETMRYEQGWMDVVHPSPMSYSGIGVSLYDDRNRMSSKELSGREAHFIPARPCRLIARSRQGSGMGMGSAHAVQLIVPTTIVPLERLDPMQILRLLADSERSTPEAEGKAP